MKRREAKVAKRNEAVRKRDALQERYNWLMDYVPTLELIEVSVMRSINREFDALSQRCFNALVDDPGKEARWTRVSHLLSFKTDTNAM
jgi:hypothetical protein